MKEEYPKSRERKKVGGERDENTHRDSTMAL